jgi:drug/metabolite transporter (DMT)-like permease
VTLGEELPTSQQRGYANQARIGHGELWALAGAFCYALSNVFSGAATRGYALNPLLGAGMRALPTLFLCLALGWGGRKGPAGLLLADWRIFGALAASGLAVFVSGGTLLFMALRLGGVVLTTPITGTQVLWSAVIAALLLRQPLNRKMAFGMLISVVGVSLLALGRGGTWTLSAHWWLAVPFASATAVSWALSGVFVAYVLGRGVDRFQAMALSALIGVLCINAVLCIGGNMGVYGSTPRGVLWRLLLAGTLGMAGLLSFISALAHTTVASANALNSLQVGLAPLVSWIWMGESMNLSMGLGVALIMAGVIVVQVTKPGAGAIPAATDESQ